MDEAYVAALIQDLLAQEVHQQVALFELAGKRYVDAQQAFAADVLWLGLASVFCVEGGLFQDSFFKTGA